MLLQHKELVDFGRRSERDSLVYSEKIGCVKFEADQPPVRPIVNSEHFKRIADLSM